MTVTPNLLFTTAIVVSVLYALYSGSAQFPAMKAQATRRSEPLKYWGVMVLWSFVGIFGVMVCITEFRENTAEEAPFSAAEGPI